MDVRAYARTSTDEHDKFLARDALDFFASQYDLPIVGWYSEEETGAKLAQPELFRLLADSKPGDILLIEHADSLARLTLADWQRLRREIEARKIRVAAIDLPASWTLIAQGDELSGPVLQMANAMMLDVLEAVARKDFENQRSRQAEGLAKAKAEGRVERRGRNVVRQATIAKMIQAGATWTTIQRSMRCSRATINSVSKRVAKLA